MNKTLVTSVVAAAGLAVSSFAFGATAYRAPAKHIGSWYLGVGANYSALFAASDITPANGFTTGATYKLDSKRLGFNLFVGNRFSRRFGQEFGYSYIGKLTWKNKTATATKVEQTVPYDFYYNGYVYMPLAYGWEAFAKGGINYYRVKTYAVAAAHAGGQAATMYNHEFGLNGGLGIQWNYQQFGIRAAYNHMFVPNRKDDLGENKVPDTVNLDLIWHFA